MIVVGLGILKIAAATNWGKTFRWFSKINFLTLQEMKRFTGTGLYPAQGGPRLTGEGLPQNFQQSQFAGATGGYRKSTIPCSIHLCAGRLGKSMRPGAGKHQGYQES
jgi:hypothetical protein